MPAPQKKVPVNRVTRILFDSITLSTAVQYSMFTATPSATLPNNYQRNPLPYSLTKIYGIRADLNANSLTPAVVTILHSSQIVMYKNQLSVFSSSMTPLFGIDSGGNFSATNQFVIFRPTFYSFGKESIKLKDTEPFQFIITFGTAPTNTDVMRLHLNTKTEDRLEKAAN